MESKKEKTPTARDISPLRRGSDASTSPNSPSPERPSVPRTVGNSSGARQAASMNVARVRKRARHGRRRVNETLMMIGSWDLRTTLLDPGLVMKVSAMATISGTVCVLLAVFSGPVLLYLAVISLGICGMCNSIRQRGALEYLPRGVVELLTRTTLLEFLTDTTLFDAIKNYLVFMMGLSEEETKSVLRSLPESMRNTLTRPGLMHILPTPLQSLLLPMNQSASTARDAADVPRSAVEDGRGSGLRRRRRRHRLMAEASENRLGEVMVAVAQREGDSEHEHAEREAPLGQLVWNPLPSLAAPETPSPVGDDAVQNEVQLIPIEQGIIDERSDTDGSDLSVIYSADGNEEGEHPEEKMDENEVRELEETRAAVRRRGVAGQNGRRNSDRRHPWARSPQRSHSLPPLVDRHQAQGHAPVDGNRTRASARSLQGHSSVSLELRAMSRGTDNPGGDSRGYNTRLELQAAGLLPSAERIMASIVQSRVDNALKAAWNLVDERSVRRAALGSGVALAAHVALSKGARRQATLMLRGGLLACLAGTVTVCAGLVYVKRRGLSLEFTGAGPAGIVDRTQTEHSPERNNGDNGGRRPSRVYKWLVAMTPSTRNLVRLLGMICLLLVIRKWQLLRRVAGRAMSRRSIYYTISPS